MSEARQRVADTALRLFAQRGYDGVSMRDLAGALSIQAPSLYSHYPSKADLLRSLLTPALEGVNALLDEAPIGGDKAAQRDWLIEYERWLIEHQEACRVALFDLAVRADPIVGPAVLLTRERVLDLMLQFGAVNDGAARAAMGALIYPAVVVGASEEEIPQIVDAAIRALGVEP